MRQFFLYAWTRKELYLFTILCNVDGKVLGGNLPKKQRKLVDAWIELHKDELKAAWHALNNDGEIIKIKGLE